MKIVSLLRIISASCSVLASPGLANYTSLTVKQVSAELGPLLSTQNLITSEVPARWSDFDPPHPLVVVNVETELDVAVTVKYCVEKKVHVLAQNGGAGWATFDQSEQVVLINMARLNGVTFNSNKTQVSIGGGSTINNTIAHAYAAGALVETGNCNCVGTLGAILGGGYGNLMGLYGFGVDNVLSLTVVTADGQLRNVTPSSAPDLFWGLRGAGPNFGIVTSAVVKSYPASQDDMQAWSGGLVFNSDDLEEVVQAIQDLDLQPEMNVFLYYISDGSESNTPIVLATVFLYKGNATSGRDAFASLYAIGPLLDSTAVLPYNQWNAGGDQFCNFGARKPSYGAGFQNMVPSTWRQIWDEYVAFQQQPGAQNSVVLLEAYSLEKARSVDAGTSAFPYRNINFNAVAIPWYEDAALDSQAQAFGSMTRDLWRSTDGLAKNSTYINFAHGDEDLDVVYGESLPRLQSIKHHFDPTNYFNQWYDIR